MAVYCSNANSAAWHKGLMNEECVSTVQRKKKTKGEMKDIKYWCVRQECQCKAVGEGKQRENISRALVRANMSTG